MKEFNEYNPFRNFVSVGLNLKISELAKILKDKELTGKFHVNDVALVFETKVKAADKTE